MKRPTAGRAASFGHLAIWPLGHFIPAAALRCMFTMNTTHQRESACELRLAWSATSLAVHIQCKIVVNPRPRQRRFLLARKASAWPRTQPPQKLPEPGFGCEIKDLGKYRTL